MSFGHLMKHFSLLKKFTVLRTESDVAKFNASIGDLKSLVNSRYSEHKRLFP